MTKPIGPGTIQVVDASSQQTVGYAFTVDDGQTRIERWVLYPEYVAPPQGSIVLQRPTDASLRFTTLTAWDEALQSGALWREGSKYVKASFTTSDSIPQSPVPPAFPQPEPPGQPRTQLDGGMCQASIRSTTIGYVFTELLSTAQSVEYWVFIKDFTAPPSGTAYKVQGGGNYGSTSDFLAAMRQLDVKKFVMVASNTYDQFVD